MEVKEINRIRNMTLFDSKCPVVYAGGHHIVCCDGFRHWVCDDIGNTPWVTCNCNEWVGGCPAKK
jgi:hypothetical protein